jgi:hypothetical protein
MGCRRSGSCSCPTRAPGRVLIPAGVADASLRTDGLFAYRDLEACLALVDGYVDEIERFGVIGYMGHL